MKILSYPSAIAVFIHVNIFLLLPESLVRAQTLFPHIDTTGLIAWYNFEESFEEVQGKFGEALPYYMELGQGQFCNPLSAACFSSDTSLLKLPLLPSIANFDEFTISFMIYLEKYPQEETRIISCSDSSDHNNGSFWISIFPYTGNPTGGAWSFTYADKSGQKHTTKAELGMQCGSWIPYTITYNGSDLLMYMGPEPVSGTAVTGIDINDLSSPLWIGNITNREFSGKIDHIFLYKRALSGEEIGSYVNQYTFWPGEDEETITGTLGNIIELKSDTRGPFVEYAFLKDSVILQEGSDSIYRIRNLTHSCLGEYTCMATNCNHTQEKTFTLELHCMPSDLEIIGISDDLYVYKHENIIIELELSGASEATSYEWFMNEKLLSQNSQNLELTDVSELDSGYYYCRILDQCDTICSDSVYLGLLENDAYPHISTDNLIAYYGFNGNYLDSTSNTKSTPGLNNRLDSGMFAFPNTAATFIGPENFMEIHDTSYVDPPRAFSLILLVKMDSLPDKTSALISKPGMDTNSIGHYSLFADPKGILSFSVTGDDGSVFSCTSKYPMKQGKWQFICAYYDGEEIGIILDKDAGDPVHISTSSLLANNTNLLVGNPGSGNLSMTIDEFRIYNKGMKREFPEYTNSFRPMATHRIAHSQACPGTETKFDAWAYGPYIQYRFYKDTITFQKGDNSSYTILVEDENDLGNYYCDVYNACDTCTLILIIEDGKLYEGLYLYDSNDDLMFYSEHDDVHMNFYVSTNLVGLEYEMYHNGILMPDVFRGIVRIEDAGPEAMGEYYFVVINGCERLVSDTVTLVMQGMDYITYEVQGWDWTSSVSGNGNSYFSSICRNDNDSSYVLLGHFSGGLKVDDTEFFSSQMDDIFIIRYDKNGNTLWSQTISSPYYKGSGDVATDQRGNVFVSGSFRNSLNLGDQSLTTDAGTGCAYLAKYNSQGVLQWLKTFESSGAISCSNLEIGDGGKILLGGNFENTLSIGDQTISGTWNPYSTLMYVAAFDSDGNNEWLRYAVTDQNMWIGFGLTDMDLSISGDLIVAGTYSGQLDLGNGIKLDDAIESPFIAKFDTNGQTLWSKSMKSVSGFAETFDLSVDKHDRIYLTGMYLADMSFDTISISYQDNLMEEIFLARFDTDGNCEFLKSYGSTGDGGDFGICFEPVSDSIAYMLGMYGDELIMGNDTLIADPNTDGAGISPNLFLCEMNSEGEARQLVSAGIRSNDFFGEIMGTNDGRVVFAGLNEVSTTKKSVSYQNITLAFAGLRGFEADTTGGGTVIDTTGGGTVVDTTGGGTVVDTTDIDNIHTVNKDSMHFLLYPNPSSSVIHVETANNEIFNLELYSLQGRSLYSRRQQASYILDVKTLKPGIYFFKLSQNNEFTIKKLIVR